jgi:hypothetical protein
MEWNEMESNHLLMCRLHNDVVVVADDVALHPQGCPLRGPINNTNPHLVLSISYIASTGSVVESICETILFTGLVAGLVAGLDLTVLTFFICVRHNSPYVSLYVGHASHVFSSAVAVSGLLLLIFTLTGNFL